MPRKNFDADTKVVVQRTVTVSTEWTVSDLAEMTGQGEDYILFEFANGRAQNWINECSLAEMVPDFNRASTAGGDTLDIDSWAILAGGRRA